MESKAAFRNKSIMSSSTPGYSFGTFKGVFLPSLLTILGVIMYMRFGWVLGQVGMKGTLAIVCLAMSISFVTALSMSALATNMKVGKGGAYYIISRSLGLEIGASVGIPLYFAQAIGIAFYVAGFTETLVPMIQSNETLIIWLQQFHITAAILPQVIGVLILVLLTLMTLVSAELALKSQFGIFILLLLSLVVIFKGKLAPEILQNAPTGKISTLPFFAVFAVFFPAVTGFEAGASMSGDLKNPSKSLPIGTLAVIGVGLLIYLAIPVGLYYNLLKAAPIKGKALLLTDNLILTRYSFSFLPNWCNIVMWAIWGASISSAIGALLGAPRTLQALSKDSVVPSFIGKGYGANKDPRMAIFLTFLIALGGILLGDLNLIAPVLSMFFLTSYCLLNLSAAFEGLVGSATWRPTFKVHWSISLLGSLACLSIMLKINLVATCFAVMIAFGIYLYMQRKEIHAHWGDVRSGVLMLTARNIIYQLQKRNHDERSWQPNLMVFSGAPTSRWHLIQIADALAAHKGFLTVCAIVGQETASDRIRSMEKTIREYLHRQGLDGLAKVHADTSVLIGAYNLIRTYGFGPVIPNTILLGETEEPSNFVAYARLIQSVYMMKKNVIIFRESTQNGEEEEEKIPVRIDIWWRGWTKFAAFKLAIAFLLKKNEHWSDAQIVLKSVVPKGKDQDTLAIMESFIKATRLEASAEVIVEKEEGESIWPIIRKESSDADLVFLGLRPPKEGETAEEYSQYYEKILANSHDLPPALYTLNAEDVEFQRIFQ